MEARMGDITLHYRFQRILVEAGLYRSLRAVVKKDPEVSTRTATLIRDIIATDRDDFAWANETANA
jgi:hypothetical protein